MRKAITPRITSYNVCYTKLLRFEQIKPQGNAKLLTYTSIFNLPWGFDQRFLIIGVAEFENKIKAMGQIKADSVDQLKLGMRNNFV